MYKINLPFPFFYSYFQNVLNYIWIVKHIVKSRHLKHPGNLYVLFNVEYKHIRCIVSDISTLLPEDLYWQSIRCIVSDISTLLPQDLYWQSIRCIVSAISTLLPQDLYWQSIRCIVSDISTLLPQDLYWQSIRCIVSDITTMLPEDLYWQSIVASVLISFTVDTSMWGFFRPNIHCRQRAPVQNVSSTPWYYKAVVLKKPQTIILNFDEYTV